MKFAIILSLLIVEFMAIESHRTAQLVARIMQEHFRRCEIVVVNGLENYDSSLIDSRSTVDLSYDFPFSVGYYIVELMSVNATFHRIRDIHRFLEVHCSLGVFQLAATSITPEVTTWLFSTLTPLYLPIIRKDEDYFVFYCSNDEDAEQIMLSPDFGNKIKFKVGLVSEDEADHREEAVSVNIVDLYGGANGSPIMKKLEDTQISSSVDTLFPDTTINFNGKMFRVANPKAAHYYEMRSKNGNNYPIRGLYKIWLDVMMSRYNFTIHLFQSSLSGGTGKQLANGTWLGAVADVLHGEADMAIFIGHIYNRHTFVEWSAPVSYEVLVFITHKPKTYFTPTTIFRPFPLTLWIGFLASLAVICVTLQIFVKYRISTTLEYLIVSFMEQDAQYYMNTSRDTVRMLVAFWLFFALIISTAYRGKLVSLMAFPAVSWVPKSFADLAYSHYRCGLNVLGKGGAAYSILSTSKNPIYQSLFQRMERYADPAVCLKEGLSKDIGCVMWKSIAHYTEHRNFTDKFDRTPFQHSEQTTSFIADGYIWEKRAIFRKHIDKLTWSIMETGLGSHWLKTDLNSVKKARLEWERATGDTSSTAVPADEDGPSKLMVVHFIGLIYLYLSGHVCAVGCFLLERYFRRRTHFNASNENLRPWFKLTVLKWK